MIPICESCTNDEHELCVNMIRNVMGPEEIEAEECQCSCMVLEDEDA